MLVPLSEVTIVSDTDQDEVLPSVLDALLSVDELILVSFTVNDCFD